MKNNCENPGTYPSQMDLARFLETFGGIYEHSSWVAEQVYKRRSSSNLDTVRGLHEALSRVVNSSPMEKKLALLRAHPDLAGKLAVTGKLSQNSSREQESAQLDRCSPEEFAEFQELNEAYKKRFGFPFIYAVLGKTRQEILENFRGRVNNSKRQECAEALNQVHRIAFMRLKPIFEDAAK